MTELVAEGPCFDDLAHGDVFDTAPPAALTEGSAAVHAAIVGERLRLALDPLLGRAVTGEDRPPASPSLAWDLAIGQSTPVTHHVSPASRCRRCRSYWVLQVEPQDDYQPLPRLDDLVQLPGHVLVVPAPKSVCPLWHPQEDIRHEVKVSRVGLSVYPLLEDSLALDQLHRPRAALARI